MTVENLALAQTTGYAVQIEHRRSEGIYASPVAGPGPQNASLVRLHAPFETISVYWTATSEGKPPVLPSHKSYLNNLNRVFLGGERVGVVTPTLVGHIWVAAGRYDYVVVGPEGLDSAFNLARCPWETNLLAEDFYVPAANFVTSGILNPKQIIPNTQYPDPDVLLLQTMIQG